MTLKRVGPFSVGRILGVMYATIGAIAGCIFALFSLVGAGLSSMNDGGPAWLGALFGVGAIIFLPVFYGLIGFIAGLIGAGLYNLFAGIVGGIELDLE